MSKSEVSRQFVESSAEVLKQLMERRLEEWEILIVYLDGIVFGDYHAIAAIGVDTEGSKHILGLREGASENKVVAKALLEDLVCLLNLYPRPSPSATTAPHILAESLRRTQP